jgi:hypothetical protein
MRNGIFVGVKPFIWMAVRDGRQIVGDAGTGGAGECIGRSGRVAADRVGGEGRRGDEPRLPVIAISRVAACA